MSKFNVGDQVRVVLSDLVTTVQEVNFVKTFEGTRSLYRLEGRPATVWYLDSDLEVVPKHKPQAVQERKKTNSSTTSDDLDLSIPAVVLATSLYPATVEYNDDQWNTPDTHSHVSSTDDSSTYSTPSWSGDSSYDSGSSSSSDSSSSSSFD